MSQGNRSRRSLAQGDNGNEEFDGNLEEGTVNECVRFIVCREGSKVPLKRSEIVKYLSTACQAPSSSIQRIIAEANKRLKQVYGYKLVQVEARGGIQFIVVLNDEAESMPPSSMDLNHRRILVAALLHIYMSGGPVKDDDMWKFLAESGLLEENDHAGRKLLIHTFTRQMYLLFNKVGDGDLARNVFEWGQRATEEVPKLFLLNKMAEAFDKTPDHWCEQHREATADTGAIDVAQ